MPERQFVRKLLLIVLIKLVLLFGLWWAFFRDQQVVVTSESMARSLQTTSPQPTETGEIRHGR